MITKDAGFIDGFLKTVIDKVNFKEKPFETIFGILGPPLLWKINWVLGAAAYAAESFGYGVGRIGSVIDNFLKSGGAENISQMDLSDSNLKSASILAENDLLNFTQGKTSSADYFLENIYMIKKSITANDIVSACYAGKIYKEAKGRVGMVSSFLGSVSKGKRLGLANILYGVLKMFAKGLIGLGVVGGIRSMVKESPMFGGSKDNKENKEISVPTNARRYANTENDVERTIIKLLNTIKFKEGTFENVFENIYKVSLENSSQMSKLLTNISFMNNGAPISTINNWDIFYAPSLKNLAGMLMPEFNYNKPNKELTDFLKEF